MTPIIRVVVEEQKRERERERESVCVCKKKERGWDHYFYMGPSVEIYFQLPN
jgi:hypothetical protein